MGVRVPLRAQRTFVFFLNFKMQKPAANDVKPTAMRWAIVGTTAYVGWFFANVILGLLFPLLLLIEALGGKSGLRFLRSFTVWFLRRFFLGYLPMTGLYRVSISEPDRKRLATIGRCLVVSNHRSWLDALILIALIPNVRVIVSQTYTRVPLVGRGMAWVGCFALDRQSRASVIEGMKEVRVALNQDAPVAVFPEGTRAALGQIKPFSDVFFRAAIEEQTRILPLLLQMSHPFLGPGTENFLTSQRATLTVKVLDQVQPVARERGRDLAYRVRRQMGTVLKELDAIESNQSKE
jgi:1-acyl-sn-glycerol-3-phosphate acyltransferase